MAALIAGHGHGSSSGIQGIAPSAKILPVIITKTGREINPRVMARGVEWATGERAAVINISSGGGPSFDLRDAVEAAINKNVVVVAAVGNASSEAIINYPAAFDGVLAVGATGRSGQHSSISVKDSRIQICAPGVDIISARRNKGYGTATGTSDSTAIVSGAVALIRSKFPELSAKEVVHRLTATADDIGAPGRDDECGFGRLNIVKALTAEVAPLEAGNGASPSGGGSPSVGSGDGRSGFSSPEAGAPRDEGSAGSGRVWVFGGLAGLLAALGVLGLVRLRRRGRVGG
jgi:subtilisin family serine protease